MVTEILRLSLIKLFANQLERKLLIAVSGGIDSMVLLHALMNLRVEFFLDVMVATFDHQIRAQGAQDADFVAHYCQQHGIRCVRERADVPAISASHAHNLEATAREIRYQFLVETALAHQITTVLTAHHADDQAETVLMHFLRGSGLDGLTGMQPSRKLNNQVTLFRPLLKATRAMIEAYAEEQHVPFVEDVTNNDVAYTRNRIRHELLPILKTFNPDVVSGILRSSETLNEDASFLNEMVHQAFNDGEVLEKGWRLSWERWQALSIAIRARLLRLVHSRLSDKQLEVVHVREALAILETSDVRKVATFSGGVIAQVSYSQQNLSKLVTIEKRQKNKLSLDDDEIAVTLGKTVHWRIQNVLIEARQEPSNFLFPTDATLTLRGRRNGDKFRPEGLNGKHTSLNEWFVDQRIAREVRDSVPLVCVDGEIAAIGLPERWVGCYGFTEQSLSGERALHFQNLHLTLLTQK